MGDEIWAHHFEWKYDWHLIQWYHITSRRKEKLKNVQSTEKIMATAFLEDKVIILVTFLHRDLTVNSDC
jgi:hypothetical protein